MAKVLGISELTRKLHRIPTAAEDAAVDALNVGADEMVIMAKSLVRDRSGDLSASIKKEPREFKGGRGLQVVAGDEKAFYARWVEHGHSGAPAYPFFFVAWRALRRRIRGRVTRNARKAIKKAIK